MAKPEGTTTSGTTVESKTTQPLTEITTGPVTTSTTSVVEKTTTALGSTTTIKPVTSTPSVSTTTSKGPSTTKGTTAKTGETTTSETTIESKTTQPPKEITTGPVTTSTTSVVEKTTTVPGSTTTSKLGTSTPSVRTTTTRGPSTTKRTKAKTEGTTTSETTVESKTTQPPKEITTGPVTTSTTSVVETTTTAPRSTIELKTTELSSTITPYTKGSTTTTTLVTETSSETTLGVFTGSLQSSTRIVFPTTVSSSTTCFCIANGTSHHSGDLIYNVTDTYGWCYFAYCNASCQTETDHGPCQTIPATTAGSTTTVFRTTTKVPLSIPARPPTFSQDCNDLTPPRKNGETWMIDNCTSATCLSGKVSMFNVSCPTTTKPICTNGRQPVEVTDDSGCCSRYECECVCSVWSKSHFLTFDGKTYTFSETCSYYLVKEIITKYNLTIIVNHNCDTSESSFCSMDLIVVYKSSTIRFSQIKTSGTVANAVFLSQKRIYSAMVNPNFIFTSTNLVMNLQIPELNVKVVYQGSSFSIDLPYSLFKGNTEGQCGTCDNSQANDCRAPNGQLQDCTDSAGQWKVPDTSCVMPTTVPTTVASRTTSPLPSTTQTSCKPAICDLLTSSVFAPCNNVIPPAPWIKTCVSDSCDSGENSCSSLEAYATQCSLAGICIDWRNSTNGLCEHKCPDNKEYRACGPTVEPTCNNRYNTKFQEMSQKFNVKAEGCFCPQGTTLFNTVYDTCVTTCDCVGPDGKPKQPGDQWMSGCNNCICDQDSMSVQCNPVQCSSVTSPDCSQPGQQLVNTTKDCCPTQTCECNTDLCPGPVVCSLGFQLNITMGVCCPTYECIPKHVCVWNTTEIQPGQVIPTPEIPVGGVKLSRMSIVNEPKPCHNCHCGSEVDPATKLNIIVNIPMECKTDCSEGFEYVTSPDKCCGTCVQKSCVFTAPDNKTVVIQVNHTHRFPTDPCVEYTCEKVGMSFITREIVTTCPAFHPLDCEPGTETTDARGCCKTCTVRSVCEVQSALTDIVVGNCKSRKKVNLTSCAGHCGSLSIYSATANAILHQCDCCQEDTTTQKKVELLCSDGSTMQHSYIAVQTCRCIKSKCESGTTSKPSRRRRR
uniref:Intestinal mucin-like protein n=1 Tax=Gouania willdenowi TaxID=441366 RepID=A0A8C5NAB7_GOUWI